jgi:hypothetical protein
MDDKALDALLGNTERAAPAKSQDAGPMSGERQEPQDGQLEVDPEAAANFLGYVQSGLNATVENAPPANIAEAIGMGNAMTPGITSPSGGSTKPTTPEQRLDTASAGGAAAVSGGLKSVFETKDFLFGDTPRDQQSAFRQGIEDYDAALKDRAPVINGLASGIGQFSVAMVGLGKLGMVAKALPYVGEGVAAISSLKGGSAALEAGKAALAGSIAFDPHEERLSNLIQDTALANPFNAWLAAKPGDSAAMGRMKNAMESLGMDAAIIGTFAGGLRIWKYLKAGDTAAASRAASALEAEQRANIETERVDTEVAGQDSSMGWPSDHEAGLTEKDLADAKPEGNTVDLQANAEPQLEGYVKVEPEGVAELPMPEALSLPQSASPGATTLPVEPRAVPENALAPITEPKGFMPLVDFDPKDLFGKPGRPGSMDVPQPGLLDDVDVTLENAEKDWGTMDHYGDWQKVKQAGEDLSPDMGTFYDRFRTDNDVLEYMDIAVNHKAEQLASKGFRARVSDDELQRQVKAFSQMADMDPAELAGQLQQAGEASNTLTAKMIVSGSLASKAFTDASNLAALRKIGDYTKYGSLEAMEEEIAKRFAIATTFLKYTDEMRSQAGRSLRANRGRPFDASLFEGLSKDRFYDLLAESKGSPEKLKVLADPGLYRKIMDTVNYMRISSLVSGPKTQLINIMTNGYMLSARPLERILGGAWLAVRHPITEAQRGVGRQLMKENLKQYAYFGTAFMDGFSQAVRAIVRNDGLLRPHSSEAYGELSNTWKVPGTQAIDRNYFKPWDSTGNLIYNALSVPLTAVGVAPRALGGIDELVKQITYRSKVMAAAHLEGMEQAIQSGLKGKAAKDYVKSYVSTRVDKAFDAEGRGLDADALREANIATFQQDLLPGTLGKVVQDGITNERSQIARLILPFVKTPTNVLRYGWKMTPGLNWFQSEYRQMLSGKLGHEARAQAVGQMSMGSLFLGSGAYLAWQGIITGGGPSDPQLKSQLLATGWQPYSIVKENDDGSKTYIPFSRYDPVALPFGIIADIQDALHIMGGDGEGSPEIQNAIGALMISLSKSFTSRTYLLSLNQALEALSDPDRNGGRFVGGVAQSFVPFSAFTRQTSSDIYLRDARTVADKMMQVIPGLSANMPPRYNWLGQPMLNRQGLWTDTNGSAVDMETERLGLEGYRLGTPDWKMGGSKGAIDLRDITTVNGENAYIAYQRLAGKPMAHAPSLREAVAKLFRSDRYQNAPDGEAGLRQTKMWLITRLVGRYRDVASRQIRSDKNVRDALLASQRKVIDRFAHLKQPPSKEQKAGLQAILNGFGAGSK